MKKSVFVVMVVLFVIGIDLSAQVEIKVDPVQFLIGQAGGSAELLIGKEEGFLGIELMGSYKFKIESAILPLLIGQSTGLDVSLLPKFYLGNGQGWDGFYFAPYAKYLRYQTPYEGSTITYQAAGVGVGAGYKWVSKPGVLFEVGGGIGRNLYSSYSDPLIVEELFLPFNFLIRASVGYRF